MDQLLGVRRRVVGLVPVVGDEDEEDPVLDVPALQPPDESREGSVDVLHHGTERRALRPLGVGHLVGAEEVREDDRRRAAPPSRAPA